MNKKLSSLYIQNWQLLSTFRKGKEKGISAPLLLSKTKGVSEKVVMIVGQQTNRWENNLPASTSRTVYIKTLMKKYSDFLDEEKPATHFWRFYKLIEGSLTSAERISIYWNNLLKCDQFGAQPSKAVTARLKKLFPVIREEFRIINPEVIFFVSGPEYDLYLKELFPGLVYKKISGFLVKDLARLQHPQLPQHSYRTYHPNYLCRFKKPLLDKMNSNFLNKLTF